MIKKVLLIAAFIIFAVSCSKTPTNPNNGNTGDSGIINGGSGTTEPTAISDFLKIIAEDIIINMMMVLFM
ncbi:hypothetical protein [Brachyspira hyodysenteriae]|uniref:hypothetical protein n=1 Tax=Brachyspira hyodysenteriae TaxID=159 RepID=UPI0022CD9DB6|nr:hypothetical protein [Brachyspira hyodysenteriae]MCZ9878956.1 hypothetical protein [Brachyspira hyodysenteriae]MCZ9956935.1 hypothetical protein [Brachyspira hyodysenteriae]